ncbi:probable protein phosphatase 2C 26 isoform X2 [Solanum dulcamara]|uniref:probable protein phosphatase 2C 26 isoform X2 n=1 Tax=Solanum dulcamara TaxID=45834 RepID=UPI002485C860|nr:probable protein phosphatase 2C 26 isoform X2 [Solanum dulcamara]
MAISIFRHSLSPPQNLLFSTNSQKFSSISVRNRNRFLRCASTDSAPPTRQEMSLSVGMYLIPHPNKVEKGGEDAFFVSSDNGEVIAVADGVSGWAEKNVDPALFSRELVANVSSLVENAEVNYDPRILIKGAHASTSSIGSATVMVSIFKNGILKIASVGDCGLRVIRKGQMIFSTFPLEHYFDCPYQLSSEAVTQTYLDAIVSTVDLQVGDTIIMGTDGLFDNIFDQEIVSVVTTHDDVSHAVVWYQC